MINILDDWRNSRQSFIFFDCESENLSLFNQRPWQLSYVIYQGGRLVEEVDDHIWIDDLNVSKDAQIVTRFDYQKYKSLAKPANEVLDRFEKKAKDAILVAHNGLNFDVYLINLLYKHVGRSHDWWFMNKIIDTNALAKAYFTQRKNNQFSDWDEFIAWQYSCLSVRDRKMKTSQGAMLKHFDISFEKDRLHDALYDVKMNQQVFEKLLYGLKF